MPKQSLLEKVETFYRYESEGALKLMDDVIRRAKRWRQLADKREADINPARITKVELAKAPERPADSKLVTSEERE